jgi:hypothetical protein
MKLFMEASVDEGFFRQRLLYMKDTFDKGYSG